jgi:hypothetical protein
MPRAIAFILLVASATSATARSHFDGAWVLSGQWTGYMGIALKIDGERYKYWFYSDAADDSSKYPLAGHLRVSGDVIELLGRGSYYDRKWHRILYRGVPCLLADLHYRECKHGKGLADDRLLFAFPGFDEKHPRLNYGGEEKRDGSVSRSSPLPPK